MILLEAGSAKMAFALVKCAIAQAVKPYGFEFALAIANKVGHPNGIRTRSVYREEWRKSGLQDRCRTNKLWIVLPWHPNPKRRVEVL